MMKNENNIYETSTAVAVKIKKWITRAAEKFQHGRIRIGQTVDLTKGFRGSTKYINNKLIR